MQSVYIAIHVILNILNLKPQLTIEFKTSLMKTNIVKYSKIKMIFLLSGVLIKYQTKDSFTWV